MIRGIVIGIILLFAIFVMLSEYSLEHQTEYYRCYLKNEYRHRASNDMCCGAPDEKGIKECGCKHCRHYKNYQRYLKENPDGK